jgi:hypothetical protein
MEMVGREEQLLAVKIAETLGRAADAEREYVKIIETSSADHLNDLNNEELHDAEETLARHVRQGFVECQMLAERLQMPDSSRHIRERLESYDKASGGLTSTIYDSTVGERYCTPLAEVQSIYNPMATVALGGVVTGLSVLEAMLRNTAKIIEHGKLSPERETQVRNEVLRVLQLAFVDARKEVAIAKSFKTYKPDIGIPSLLAAVEYKFLRTKEDMKAHLDQVFADMKGYGGHPDWRNFYAVFYQKRPFFTQQDVAQALREARTDVNWIPIVLNGPAA